MQSSRPHPGPADSESACELPRPPLTQRHTHTISSVVTRKFGKMELMSPLKADAPLQGCRPHETCSPGAPCSSGLTHTELRALTCEAAGLAGACRADQSQQGQPEGPEHGRAEVTRLQASPEQPHKGAWRKGPSAPGAAGGDDGFRACAPSEQSLMPAR